MMAENEAPKGPQTLKSQIYDAQERLYDKDVLALGDKGLCGVYEALFGFLRRWIESEGNPDEREESGRVVREYENTVREEVYYDVSVRYYEKLFYLTIDRNPGSRREATIETFQLIRQDMIDTTWGNLKNKRMGQYQKLWDIFKDMTDADEDVTSKFKSARDIV